MIKIKELQAVALAFFAVGTAFYPMQSGAQSVQSEVVYNLGDPTDVSSGGLTNKSETVDVAIRITNPELVGAKIKALRIKSPLGNTYLSDAKAWLSVELPEISSFHITEPDVASKSFDIVADETIEVVFDEPYTITSEGVYAGYSFSKNEHGQVFYLTNNKKEDGFYLHSTKSYRTAWFDKHEEYNALAFEVVLVGNFSENAAAIVDVPELNVETNTISPISFVIANHGTKAITSVSYNINVSGQTIVNVANVDIPAVYGREAEIEAELPSVANKGNYTATITINQVNYVDNTDPNAQTDVVAHVYNTLPVHRAVLEEYTGAWCGYCPRGFVGLEEMNRLYPNDFIGISYHNGDAMEVTSDFPSDVSGFPAAWLDRISQTDAFSGDEEYGLWGIEKAWLARNRVFTPANIDVEATPNGGNKIDATATVVFPLDNDKCNYSVGFVLVGNGLKGEGSDWVQSNYYSGETNWPESMSQFTEGESKISGLVFNDVYLAHSSKGGISGSLKAPIISDAEQKVTYTFDLSESSVSKLLGSNVTLRVVALLIDNKTGVIVNANKSELVDSPTPIRNIANDNTQVVDVIYYNIAGQRVQKQHKGIVLKQTIYTDGSSKTTKITIK